MNLTDKFIGTKFGPYLQLEVIGWFGSRVGSNKKYTVECSICKEDSQLYGDGRFLITKSKVTQGRIPCGCSEHVRWTKEQYIIKIGRECLDRGYKFIAFSGEFNGKDSKIILETPIGSINEVLLNNFMKGQDTIDFKNSKISSKNRKDQCTAVSKFMSTGAFTPGTIFTRNETRTDSKGWKSYWNVYCPTCKESYQAHIGNLGRGTVGCSCSQRRHNKSYIHVISGNSGILGIKFGITSVTTDKRLKEQAKKSGLNIECFGIWEYTAVSSCRKAEVDVKGSIIIF